MHVVIFLINSKYHHILVRPLMTETTALGAAIAAGNAKGVDVWDMENVQPVPSDTFTPSITEDRK